MAKLNVIENLIFLINIQTQEVQGCKKLTENEILAQCWVTFLAGYETTSTTLSFCIYELAMNPEVQEKLYNELKTTHEKTKSLDFESIQDLKYLTAVIKETLRKYPPVIRLERTAKNDYALPDSNIVIKKGQVVEIPIYAVHHSKDNYHDPEKFKPERFIVDEETYKKPTIFIPFGEGPRNCIGKKLAMMEIKIALSKLVVKFKFQACAKTQTEIEFNKLTPFLATNHNFVYVSRRPSLTKPNPWV